jgi:hypothetical protein
MPTKASLIGKLKKEATTKGAVDRAIVGGAKRMGSDMKYAARKIGSGLSSFLGRPGYYSDEKDEYSKKMNAKNGITVDDKPAKKSK